jgi:tRNA threonylcarbamoyladenosine biosynthesis protein TsaE
MTALLRDEAETVAWGRRLGETLTRGDVVLLFGALGAGKTTLVRGVAEALGYAGPVLSPTYTLLEVYDARMPIYHFDFYRVGDVSELRAVDPREYYDAGVTLMEWPERVQPIWPVPRLEVELTIEGSARRLSERRIGKALS